MYRKISMYAFYDRKGIIFISCCWKWNVKTVRYNYSSGFSDKSVNYSWIYHDDENHKREMKSKMKLKPLLNIPGDTQDDLFRVKMLVFRCFRNPVLGILQIGARHFALMWKVCTLTLMVSIVCISNSVKRYHLSGFSDKSITHGQAMMIKSQTRMTNWK